MVFALAEGTPYALARPPRPRRPGAEPRRPRHPRRSNGADRTPSPSTTSPPSRSSTRWSSRPTPTAGSPPRPSRSPTTDVTELWRARLEPDPRRPTYARSSTPSGPGPATRPVRPAAAARTTATTIVAATVTDPGAPLAGRAAVADLAGLVPRPHRGVGSGSLAAAYLHRSTAGRDLHVEVIERGYLAPFGHSGHHHQVTERQFRLDDQRRLTAILVQDDYLAVTEPAVDLPRAAHAATRAGPSRSRGRVADAGAGPVERAAITLADGTADQHRQRLGRHPRTASTHWSATPPPTAPAATASPSRCRRSSSPTGTRTPCRTRSTAYAPRWATCHLLRRGAGRRVEPDLGGQPVGWADPDTRGHGGLRPGHRAASGSPWTARPWTAESPRPPSGPS